VTEQLGNRSNVLSLFVQDREVSRPQGVVGAMRHLGVFTSRLELLSHFAISRPILVEE